MSEGQGAGVEPTRNEEVREILDRLSGPDRPRTRGERIAALRRLRGICRDRADLPDLAELRAEWDRRIEFLEL